MHPTEFVQCREAVAGGTGGKQSHGIFVPGMLLALDFRDFPSAEIAVSFEYSQKIARLDRDMLTNIADEYHPHVVFLSKA